MRDGTMHWTDEKSTDARTRRARHSLACCAAVIIAVTFGAERAWAQSMSTGLPPLALTSPLGLGPSAPVGPVGVPMGATQTTSPGISPAPPGSYVPGTISGSSSGCGSAASLSMTQGMSTPTALFDARTSGTASGGCASTGGATSSDPAASQSSPSAMGAAASVGRVGIPMGSSELAPGGISPFPTVMIVPVPGPPPILQSSGVAPVPPNTTVISPLSGVPVMTPGGGPQGSGFAPPPLTTGRFASCPGMPGNIRPSSIPGSTNFTSSSC